MAPKIAIVYYSMYGHMAQLAKAEAEGVKKAGGSPDLYQLPETLPTEVLTKMYAPKKDETIPVLHDPATLTKYDGIIMGIPTRFGSFPAQWKSFWDSTGQIWMTAGYHGKYAGVFVGSAGQGGGQEVTAQATMSTFAHHGIIFVPLGSAPVAKQLSSNEEVRGGSAWGAGTFSNGDGSRQPSKLELEVATIQGEEFFKTVAKAHP